MTYDRKTNYTKQQLKDSLIARIEEKPFDKITINDIVAPIHLNRSTLYRYYDDKYQLLETIENEVIHDLSNRQHQPWEFFTTDSNIDQLREFLAESLRLYQDNAQVLHALLGPNGDHSFEGRLGAEFKKNLRQAFPEQTVEMQMMQEMMQAMALQGFRYQLFHADELSPDKMIELLLGVIQEGPLNYLSHHYNAK